MLEAVINTLVLIRDVTYWTFVISYKIGHAIVQFLSLLLNFIVFAITSLVELWKILGEDFGLFIVDLKNKLGDLGGGIKTVFASFTSCFEFIAEILESLTGYLSSGIWKGITEPIGSVFTFFGQIITGLKHLLILLGSGTWFALTFVPNTIFFLSDAITKFTLTCLQRSVLDIYQICKNCVNTVCNFVDDIPMESFFALVLLTSLTFYIVKRSVPVRQYTQRFLRSFSRFLRRLMLRTRRKVLNYFRRNPTTVIVQTVQVDTQKDCKDETRYCVVCQERDKCILMLPCRHVCLCSECEDTLQYYNRVCPICRCDVRKTMKVFI